MKIQFTPQPLFFETTTEWAQALQDIYAGQDAQTRLDSLVESLTEQLQDAGISNNASSSPAGDSHFAK